MRLIGKMALLGTMLAGTMAVALPAQAATTITVTANLGGTLSIDGVYTNQDFAPQFVTFTGISSADAPTIQGDYSTFELSSLKLASSVNGSDGIVDFGGGYVFGSGTVNGAAISGFGKQNGFVLVGFSDASFAQSSSSPAPFTATNAAFTDRNGSVSFTSGNLISRSVDTTVAAPVPEPATWAMMIGGFGMIGGVMRRRQRNASTSVRFA